MSSAVFSDQKPAMSLPPSPPAVEYKKDGSVSRMRSHRGNIPQLPQTKLCPYCPAKFTRTTHLNRHLRNREPSILPVVLLVRRADAHPINQIPMSVFIVVRCGFHGPTSSWSDLIVFSKVCHAQFTRSDLLARHKRSCGES